MIAAHRRNGEARTGITMALGLATSPVTAKEVWERMPRRGRTTVRVVGNILANLAGEGAVTRIYEGGKNHTIKWSIKHVNAQSGI